MHAGSSSNQSATTARLWPSEPDSALRTRKPVASSLLAFLAFVERTCGYNDKEKKKKKKKNVVVVVVVVI